MNGVLLVIVLVSTATIVGLGVYVTFRGFRTANTPEVDEVDVPRRAKIPTHDPATIARLKHFFDGKACASCGRPIPPVHAGQLHPGLLNTRTNEAIAWNDIPVSDLSGTLANHSSICSNCLTVETLRREHPELVVDRHRTIENPLH